MFKQIFCIIAINLFMIASSKSGEIIITSKNLEVDRKNKISIFSGSVYAHNQNIEIWSDQLLVNFDNNKNEIQQLNAAGNVKIIKEEITATGENGLYSIKSDVLSLYGNVEVFENNNYVKCDELYLDIKNSSSIMKSTSSERVEAYISSK